MATDLQLFNFDSSAIRVLADANGGLWFVARDIAAVLGYASDVELSDHIDEDDAQVFMIQGFGSAGAIFINEAGLYSAIFSSEIPAKIFKKWIATEVIPAARKNRKNSSGRDAFADHDTVKQRIVSVLIKKGPLTEGVLIRMINRKKRREILNAIKIMLANGELIGVHEQKTTPTTRYFLV